MLNLSEVLLQDLEIQDFQALQAAITRRALEGEIHFRMDIKPPFADTPIDWEERLEAAVYAPNPIPGPIPGRAE